MFEYFQDTKRSYVVCCDFTFSWICRVGVLCITGYHKPKWWAIISRILCVCFCLHAVFILLVEMVIDSSAKSVGVWLLLLHLQGGLNSALQNHPKVLVCFCRTVVITERNILFYALCLSVSANLFLNLYQSGLWTLTAQSDTSKRVLSCTIRYIWEFGGW